MIELLLNYFGQIYWAKWGGWGKLWTVETEEYTRIMLIIYLHIIEGLFICESYQTFLSTTVIFRVYCAPVYIAHPDFWPNLYEDFIFPCILRTRNSRKKRFFLRATKVKWSNFIALCYVCEIKIEQNWSMQLWFSISTYVERGLVVRKSKRFELFVKYLLKCKTRSLRRWGKRQVLLLPCILRTPNFGSKSDEKNAQYTRKITVP